MNTTERLGSALRLWDGATRGEVHAEFRSLVGFGLQTHRTRPPVREVPLAIVRQLADDMTLRVAPETRQGGAAFAQLPLLFCLWRPAKAFERNRYVVTPAGVEAVASALHSMPPVSAFVDAGPEAWAAWRLDRPITDPEEALAELARLADRLGGVAPVLGEEAGTLPLAGPVRNWNNREVERIRIVRVDPALTYSLTTLLKEAHDVDADTGAAAAARGRGRRREARPA
jgi:hypothetical protein